MDRHRHTPDKYADKNEEKGTEIDALEQKNHSDRTSETTRANEDKRVAVLPATPS